MIAYEIQLPYVIRDKIREKIQSKKKFIPRQNPVQDKIQPKKKQKISLSEKNFVRKICLGHCLRFPVHYFSCLGQIDAYHH